MERQNVFKRKIINSVSQNITRVNKQAIWVCYEQLPLKEPDSIWSWPAVLKADPCPNTRVVVNYITEIRMYL